MKEVHDVMNTIKGFTAEDATVIVGTVIDEAMADSLRVTMVATGLGAAVNRAPTKPLTVVKTGTDTSPLEVVDYDQSGSPGGHASAQPGIHCGSDAAVGRGMLDIPAFLRKQAD